MALRRRTTRQFISLMNKVALVGEKPFRAVSLVWIAAQEVNAFGRCQQDGKYFAKYLRCVWVGTMRRNMRSYVLE